MICAWRLAACFDFPVSGRSIGQRCGVLINGNAELDGNVGAGIVGDALPGKRDGVFVEFVADYLGTAIVAHASRHRTQKNNPISANREATTRKSHAPRWVMPTQKKGARMAFQTRAATSRLTIS